MRYIRIMHLDYSLRKRNMKIMTSLYVAGLLIACSVTESMANQNNVTLSQSDFLIATQTRGAAQRDASFSGNPLSIAGSIYKSGIGTHAVSELPVTVPKNTARFKGFVGIDDKAANLEGEVTFRILSGNAVLWNSGIVKGGEKAKPFDIELPAGCQKIYLQADDLGENKNGHANWVNLEWVNGERQATEPARSFSGAEFGLKPNIREDQSTALRKALKALQKAPGSTLKLEKGEYHFWHTDTIKRHFHISNHDQPTWQPVCIPLVDLHNVTIDGSGSLFLFHGDVQPVLIQDSKDVTLKGIAIDYEIPHHSQGVVTKVNKAFYEMKVDQKQFPHTIQNSWFMFKGEGWERPDANGGIVFDGTTREIVAGTSDYGYRAELETITDGHYRVKKNIKSAGIKPGDVITMRHGWRRPHPAVVLYRAKNTTLNELIIHFSNGMGLLAQRSENITLKGGGVFPRKETGRYFSSGADATHFSNCKGAIITDGCLYEGMMDDAINVHATCLRIEEKLDARTIRCRYVHGQAYGFETFLPSETLRFIQAKHLTPRTPCTVTKAEWIDNRHLLITLDKDIPTDLGPGDAVENADWFPSVHFTNNIVRHNRARGSLFTTPKPILVENNTFERIAGSAILLAGDSNGWYESGACHDVVIRNNTFTNNLTSRFQFTNAIISIYPEIPDLKGQEAYYHRNVRIEDNTFDTFNVPLLFAISTDGLHFTNNHITYNHDYKAWNQPPFILRRCKNVEVIGNTVKNAPFKWEVNSAFKLHLIEPGEIKLKNAPLPPQTSFKPGKPWLDDNGIHINAHGGGLMHHEGTYYWYGEHKIGGTAGNVAHVGVHVYSSKDLYNWKDEGIALKISDDPNSDIVNGCIIERPKVIYNAKTKKFVMWFHLEKKNIGYSTAASGVAVSDSPAGPFTYLRSLRPNAGVWPVNVTPEQKDPESIAKAKGKHFGGGPNKEQKNYNLLGAHFKGGQMARDMTLFIDDDGTAYHIYSSEHNGTLHISKLTDDYLRHAGEFARVFPNRWMEAPAICKRDGKYYLIASGCTGWWPNAARSAVADNIFGPWKELGNPCVGTNPQNKLGPGKTFGGQSTYILPVQGIKGAYIAMFDIWRPNNAIDGRYVWLPIDFTEEGIKIEWRDEWDLSTFEQ